jgi:hypothetical protein
MGYKSRCRAGLLTEQFVRHVEICASYRTITDSIMPILWQPRTLLVSRRVCCAAVRETVFGVFEPVCLMPRSVDEEISNRQPHVIV